MSVWRCVLAPHMGYIGACPHKHEYVEAIFEKQQPVLRSETTIDERHLQ